MQRTNRFATVGRVLKSHGLNGGVLVAFATETSSHVLIDMPLWITPPPLENRLTAIESIAEFGRGHLVYLKNITSIGQAKELAGATLVVDAKLLPDTFFDVPEEDNMCLGYSVVSEKWGTVGVIDELLETKANDVWVVTGPYGEVLLPIIDDVVVEIDDENLVVYVSVLDGLIEGSPLCE